MIEIKVSVEPYDDNHSTGIAIAFKVKGEVRRHAMLINKPIEEVRLFDVIGAVKDIAIAAETIEMLTKGAA